MTFGAIKTETEVSIVSISRSFIQFFHTSPASKEGNNPNLLGYSKEEKLFQEPEQVLG